jgi:4a-hydroxytetrahydrobiopterin dehydratase
MSDAETCDLASEVCEPCRGGVPPLTQEQWAPLLAELEGWEVVDGHHLRKSYEFSDFVGPLRLLNRVGELAEQCGHHPDLHLSWGRLTVEIWTHKVDGLTRSDFVLAAKCDALG